MADEFPTDLPSYTLQDIAGMLPVTTLSLEDFASDTDDEGDEADRWAERPRPTERRADDGIGAATPTNIACDHRYLGGAPGRARVTVNPNPYGAPTLPSPSPSPGSCCTELTPLDQHCDACRDSGSSPKFDYRPTPQTDAGKPDIWVTPAL